MTNRMTNRSPTVLFLCTGNSCRSQMAEGWAKHFHSDQLKVCSAGIATHGLNPHALQVMEEAGVDISKQTSDHVDCYLSCHLDLVVSVCPHADEHCPVFTTDATRVHMPFDDPPKLAQAETDPRRALDHYRRVRDEIRDFVRDELPRLLDEAGNNGGACAC